jgi:hypothetical protein
MYSTILLQQLFLRFDFLWIIAQNKAVLFFISFLKACSSYRLKIFYLNLQVLREEEFAPVKNANGATYDTPDSARLMLLRLHSRWVVAAGGFLTHSVPLYMTGNCSPSIYVLESVSKVRIFLMGTHWLLLKHCLYFQELKFLRFALMLERI